MPSTDTDALAIEATDLRKTYGDETALDGVSLSIPTGTVYGFLGPNGAGKTTTMRLLTGLSKPTSGTVRVCGTPVDDRRAVVPHLGYLPETPPLYEEFSAREQLEYTAELRDIPREADEDRIAEFLDEFDLAADADKRIGTYSKGMKQKTAFIQAVLHDPDVVFLDEPTSGLDPRAARGIRESIVGLAERGTTVFLSTHILPVVEAVADEVGVLFEGRVVAEGTPAELTARAETGSGGSLEDAFLAVTGGESAERDRGDSREESESEPGEESESKPGNGSGPTGVGAARSTPTGDGGADE